MYNLTRKDKDDSQVLWSISTKYHRAEMRSVFVTQCTLSIALQIK